ncbi:MarR family winged helix-turn-helix transcriptional regulator [Terrilactibacillus laevilacticus]|uniref:MarR family winged helix-turn-helix transcriptional regulator n=1 Tax=Terrilactibacillus laevilacticus TaxID=1380157 RepID=A0ABW5PQW9_9BACI|nr:MarR family transcriptional regulator [Terrilactibacillus laevilacticus]
MLKRKTRLELLLWFRLSRFYNQSIRKSNHHLKEWDLTTAQFDVLAQVGSHQPITQKDLANKLFVTKGNVTQLIRKMEKLELVERRQEWKVKYLTLTNKGEKLFQNIVPKQENYQASQFHALNKQEQKQLLELLRKLQKGQEE